MAGATITSEQVARETGLSRVRDAIPADAVLGVRPGVVVIPESTDEVSSLLRWANGQGLKVIPCGSRTKLDRGSAPASCDILVDLIRMSHILEHAAGDLTVTAQAGVGLADLQAAVARSGQWLAIDPPVPGTIGGLIATADSGPRRLRYGGVRDLLLGVTFVRADGTIARGGGKVVKNVAGYDLPKLLTGSLGTLGVITEATFRLHPLSQASTTVCLEAPTAARAATGAVAILNSPLVPTSLDYLAPAGRTSTLLVRFESSPRSIEAQSRSAVEALQSVGRSLRVLAGQAESLACETSDCITDTDAPDVLARLITTLVELPQLIEAAQQTARAANVPLSIRAHLGHGHALLRWHGPPVDVAASLLQTLRQEAEARGGNLVIWRAPVELRARVDVWGAVGEGLGLMRRIKVQLDPRGTLNPGRYAGGI